MGEMALRRALRYIDCDECFFSDYIQEKFYDKEGNDAVCRYCFDNRIKED